MKSASNKLYQVIDANLNRCGEGLRVIEEIARFVLADADLQRRTKHLRQQLNSFFGEQSTVSVDRLKLRGRGRGSETDVGRRYSTAGAFRSGSMSISCSALVNSRSGCAARSSSSG